MRSTTPSTPETPPHFARSGWTTATARDAISASKASSPIAFSPAASGIGTPRRGAAIRATAGRRAAAPRASRARARPRRRRHRDRRRRGPRPGWHRPSRRAARRRRRALRRGWRVARLAEADLELERRVAGAAQRGDRVAGPLGVDAARVDRHRCRRVALRRRARARWRQSGTPARRAARSCRAMSMPAIACAIGPGSPDWIASTAVSRRQLAKRRLRRREGAADDERREHASRSGARDARRRTTESCTRPRPSRTRLRRPRREPAPPAGRA